MAEKCFKDNSLQIFRYRNKSVQDIPLDLSMKKSKKIGERQNLICKICGKVFDRPSLLKRHVRIHSGERPHLCDICRKGFSTSSSLNTHRRIHSGERPHQCTECGKRFTASSNLYYHRMTHSKVKPHKCKDCGKTFPTPGDLRSHEYTHTGYWPFYCIICFKDQVQETLSISEAEEMHKEQQNPGEILRHNRFLIEEE